MEGIYSTLSYLLPRPGQICLGLRVSPPKAPFAKRAQRSIAHEQVEWEPSQYVNQFENENQRSFHDRGSLKTAGGTRQPYTPASRRGERENELGPVDQSSTYK